MAFIASSLDATFGDHTPYIVVGDFNVEPEVLADASVGINVGDLIRRSGLPTHFSASSGKTSEYDYALTNLTNLTVTTLDGSEWVGYSDHGPIFLDF
jgi:endonuclease/exonuclease/phosphatase family metal-dependent hydrolase